MKKILLFAFLNVTLSANAQIAVASTGMVNEYNLQSLTADLKTNKFNEIITNKDEYFDSDFKKGSISGFKEKEGLRYNALLDDFEFVRDGYLYKINRLQNQVIIFDDGKIFKLVAYLDEDNKLNNRYLQVLSPIDGKIVILKKFIVDYTDGLGSTSANSSNTKRYFKQEKLLISYDNKLYNVPNSVKKLGNLLKLEKEQLAKIDNLNLKKSKI